MTFQANALLVKLFAKKCQSRFSGYNKENKSISVSSDELAQSKVKKKERKTEKEDNIVVTIYFNSLSPLNMTS